MHAQGQGKYKVLLIALTAFVVVVVAILASNIHLLGTLPADGDTNLARARVLQFVGIGVTIVGLLVVVFYFTRVVRNDEAGLESARRETEQILATVREGLFLLRQDGQLGSEVSGALHEILRRDEFEDVRFDDILRPLVPDNTLTTAMDYVELLWGERVNANLIKDLNPLDEVEVNFQDRDNASYETRYLSFDFSRVMVDGQLSHVLVTVSDVTDRVLLARELEEAQAQSQAQLDLLLSILHVDPQVLQQFLHDTDAATDRVNATLKQPARDEKSFRAKLDGIFREIHSIKGESAALGLSTIELKAHEFEDSLVEIREQRELTGNDFLPLAIKLEDLLTHVASVRDLIMRLTALGETTGPNTPVPPPREPAGVPAIDATQVLDQVAQARAQTDSLDAMLRQLGERVAHDNGKQATVETAGLDTVPESYRGVVKTAAIQLLRNALVHGIEDGAERGESGKPGTGRVDVQFGAADGGGYQLLVRDDGRGLNPDDIRVAAIQKNLITPEQAVELSDQKTYGLIFKPGFSTAEVTSKDAGRGVGMSAVMAEVKASGGRIKLATRAGKMTRFVISLPPAPAAGAA